MVHNKMAVPCAKRKTDLKFNSYDVDFKLKVVEEATKSSNRETARKYGIDEKRIREWKKQVPNLKSLQSQCGGTKRRRLDGAGLDPAYPYYQNTDESGHLDPSDGVFVDVIHTDSGELFNGTIGAGFSFSEPLGHIDFYPNGGHRQPGCHDAGAALPDISTVCSHLRCYNLYIESIKDVNAFDSYLCKDYDEYGTGSCIDNCPAGGCPKLGYNVRTSDAGIFYLSTRDKEPFDGKQVYVTIAFANNQDKQEGHILLTLDGDSVSDTAEVLNEDSPLNSNVVYKKAVAYLNDLEDYTSGKVAFEKDGLIDSSAAHIASIEVYDPEAGTRVCTGEVRVPAGSSERIGFENC